MSTSSFRRGHSTETLLLCLLSDIYGAEDSSQLTLLADALMLHLFSADFLAAFNMKTTDNHQDTAHLNPICVPPHRLHTIHNECWRQCWAVPHHSYKLHRHQNPANLNLSRHFCFTNLIRSILGQLLMFLLCPYCWKDCCLSVHWALFRDKWVSPRVPILFLEGPLHQDPLTLSPLWYLWGCR